MSESAAEPTPAAPAAEAPKQNATEYVVLFQDNNAWYEHKRVMARSAGEAIRNSTEKSGIFLAIPARSFRPTTVEVQTQSKLVLS